MSLDSDEDGVTIDRQAMTREVEMMVWREDYLLIVFCFHVSLQKIRLSRCEFIISYYDAFCCPSLREIWISMELCPIGSALDLLRLLKNPFPEVAVRTITKDALAGLAFLHQQKIIHRDLLVLKRDLFVLCGHFVLLAGKLETSC